METNRQYLAPFQKTLDKFLSDPKYQGKRLIPFDDTTVFTGVYGPNATDTYGYQFRQKSDFIVFELRHSAGNMANLLQYPPMLTLVDTRISVPIIPVPIPTTSLMGTAANGIPLVLPLLIPGGTLWNFTILMPGVVPVPYTPQISFHGIRIPESDAIN